MASMFAAAYFVAAAPAGFPVDDAYIHLCYARSLATGQGFSFNPGEPSLGFTSPLWVMVLALAGKVGAIEAGARLVGFLSMCLSAIMVHDLVFRSLTRQARAISKNQVSLFAASSSVVFGLSGNLLWISLSGMESSLFMALGLLALWSIKDDRPAWLTGLALGLLMLCRLTGIVLFVMVCAYFIFRLKPRLRALLPLALAPVVYAPWPAFTWFGFGSLMPYTGAGKLASNLFNRGHNLLAEYRYLLWHLRYLWDWDRGLLLLLFLCLIGGLFLIVRYLRKNSTTGIEPSMLLLMLWPLLHFGLHALTFRSTYTLTPYHNLRYQVPLLAALPAGGALLLGLLADRVSLKWQAKWPAWAAAALLISVAGLGAWGMPAWKQVYQDNIEHLRQVHQTAALYVRDNLPADARVACFDIGSLKYFSERYVIDLGGLVDPEIHSDLRQRRVGPYLVRSRATHYIKLLLPDAQGLIGVEQDKGKLYELVPFEPRARFLTRAYRMPVMMHSRGMEVYKLEYPALVSNEP